VPRRPFRTPPPGDDVRTPDGACRSARSASVQAGKLDRESIFNEGVTVMKRMMCISLLVLIVLVQPRLGARGDVLVDLEDLNLPDESFYNGSDGAGGFTSHGAFFNNDYSATFDAWQGWSASTTTDTTTNSFTNQYSAYAGSGAGGSRTYAVAFSFFTNDAFVNLPDATELDSVELVNTTYTALTIRDGDPFGFSTPFGGASGDDADFFLLTITGYDALGATGQAVGSVEFYLADYRFGDPALDYIVSTWTEVDLSSLVGARSLGIAFTADERHTDDVLGLTVPTYVALDNLSVRSATVVPEPSSLVLALLGVVGVCGLPGRFRGQWY
jgi:hypothetical protein